MRKTLTRRALVALALALAVACGSSSDPDPYDHVAPPAAAVPAGLESAAWQTHLSDDLLPYWRTDAAKGDPVGNFPTYRGMDGSVQGSSNRKPRMIGRQVFMYCIAFMMTGDEAMLDLARAGTRWLIDHARDTARGGWYADLDASGAPAGDLMKTSQDTAYAVMGPAAYFFVTRDPEVEAVVLETRDLLFDPAKYWDATGGRIKDGLDGAMQVETYMNGEGSWELVAQLDPVTAFMLLVQPVLTEKTRREQMLGDLRTLQARIKDSFWRDGIFWGTTARIGQYGSWHTDFGHILKAYWALLQIDKRLDDHPLLDWLAEKAPATLTFAYDTDFQRWAKAPTSATDKSYGNDWWQAAEADQLAATLAMRDPAWITTLGATAPNFVADYVDRTRPVRELVPSVNRGGAWVSRWSDSNTAKCNEWKNGFHGAEHALIMNLFGHYLEDTPAPLYFALPADKVQAMAKASRPYTFLGRVAKIEDLRALASDPTRRVVRVSFDQLH